MNISGTGPVQPFVTASPYSPLGKPAVGQESPDTKDKPLPPVEETEALIRSSQHRIGEDPEGSAGEHRRQPGEEAPAEQAQQEGDAQPMAPALPELELNALAAQLAMRARIDQAQHAETPPPAEAPRLPPGGFEIAAPSAAGTLLDQKI